MTVSIAEINHPHGQEHETASCTGGADANAETIRALRALYGRCSPEHGKLVLVQPCKRKHAGGYETTEEGIERLANRSAELPGSYIKVNLMDTAAMSERGRGKGQYFTGKASEVKTIVSFHLDADAGKSSKYHDRGTVLKLLNSMPVPPSMIINSDGPDGGFHPYWFLAEPYLIAVDADRKRIGELTVRWQSRLNQLAHGKLDSTANIDRVLRTPGQPRLNGNLVSIHELHENRLYTLDDLTIPLTPEEINEAEEKAEELKLKAEGEDLSVNFVGSDIAGGHSSDDKPVSRYIDEVGITPESLLTEHGYKHQHGLQWVHPLSSSGERSLLIATQNDRPGINQFSGSDPNFAAIKVGGDVGRYHSVDEMFVVLKYGGDWSAAAKWCVGQLEPEGNDDDLDDITANWLAGAKSPRIDRTKDPSSVQMRQRCLQSVHDAASRKIDKTASPNYWGLKVAEAVISCGVEEQHAKTVFDAVLLREREANGDDAADRGQWDVKRIASMLTYASKATDVIVGESLVGVVVAESWNDSARIARRVLRQFGWSPLAPEGLTLRRYRGEYWEWNGTAYQGIEEERVRSVVTASLQQSKNLEGERVAAVNAANTDPKKKAIPAPSDISAQKINTVMRQVEAMTAVSSDREMPVWLGGDDRDASELTSFENGVFRIAGDGSVTKIEDRPTPLLFSPCGLDYPYDPDAECPIWTKTLKQFWPDDPESIRLLQQWCGYHLLSDQDRHKAMLIVGPTRSGKGVIARVITGLVGREAVITPRLNELAQPFGLQQWPGARAALVGDARIGRGADGNAIAESVLGIVGGDRQTVQRKMLPVLKNVKLPAKMTVSSNEIPTFYDQSGALAGRFLSLKMRVSFLGREDNTLAQKLEAERSGILNWALAGLADLGSHGFVQTASSETMREMLAGLCSPTQVFVDEYLETGETAAGEWVTKDELFRLWCNHCEREHIDKEGTKSMFLKHLYAAVPDSFDRRILTGGRKHSTPDISRSTPDISSSTPDKDPCQAGGERRVWVVFGVRLNKWACSDGVDP